MNSQITTIIPVYKNITLLLKNLQLNYQFLKQTEIIIINDDPTNSIRPYLKRYSDIILLENTNNLGFGPTINQAVSFAQGSYLLLLNTDVILRQINLTKVLQFFTQCPQLFAVSFCQKEKNGQIAGKNKIFWHKGLIQHQRANDFTAGITAWAEGGAGIFSKEIFLQLKGFDPLYSPFYWEDIDLCYRAWKMGYQIIFDPQTQVDHQHEATIGKYFSQKIKTIALRNQFIFIWKNITDPVLIKDHQKNFPKIMLVLMKHEGLTAIKSLAQAILLLPQILAKRQSQKKDYQKTDQAILQLFNEK
jgi:GT2 family glycosyltransferase